MGWARIGGGIGLAALGCGGPAFFGCDDDAQCNQNGTAGACELSGYCSFPDTECDSGRRYGELAGGGLAGLCVLDEAPTTGTPADPSTTTDTSGPPATTASGSSSTGPSVGDDTTSTSTTGTDDRGNESSGEASTGGGGIPTDDLVLWYGFEDIGLGTTTQDLSGNGLDAGCTTDHCPVAVAGPVGTAAQFDGIDDVLTLADRPELRFETGYSLSLWAWLDAYTDEFVVVSGKSWAADGSNSYEMYVDPDGAPLLFNMDAGAYGTVALGTPMPTGRWIHLVGTWDGDRMRLYADGGLVGELPGIGAPAYDDHPFTVGGDTVGELESNFWPGRVDEVRLYARELDADEVTALFAEGRP